MDPKLVKQCEVILCSFLANHMLHFPLVVDHTVPVHTYQFTRCYPDFWNHFFFLFFMLQRPEWCLIIVEKKCKLFSGSLLLLLPLVILTKHIIEFFQQNVWYYYMLDDKNNCPMNDSMKLCILDLLSCELALFSIITYSLFYTVHVHFK